jgi:hypothetical protein
MTVGTTADRAHNGICEGAGLVKWLWCSGRLGGVDGGVVRVDGGARQQGGGVQVERPQPEARTNDLDAGAGWRILDVEDDAVGC